MRILKTSLAVIGTVTVLVLAGNTISLAATGQALLLGKGNSANNITAVTRTTSGSALKLQTASSTNPPLTVNGKGKVVNLNADTLDGIDSSKFGTRALNWTYLGSIGITKTFTLTGIPLGKYMITYEAFAFPGEIANGQTVDCYVQANPSVGDNRYAAETLVTATNYGSPLSGTGLVTVNTGDLIQLVCRTTDAASTWTSASGQPVRITAVPLLSLTSKGAPTAAKVAAKR